MNYILLNSSNAEDPGDVSIVCFICVNIRWNIHGTCGPSYITGRAPWQGKKRTPNMQCGNIGIGIVMGPSPINENLLLFRLFPCTDGVGVFLSASQSALTRVIALGWHLILAYKFYEWMPFALNLCYFFSEGNSGWWYTPCITSPSQRGIYSYKFKILGV
jgi:hypothetical protein